MPSIALKDAAQRLGIGHRALMKLMREKGLLTKHNLPANPEATKHHLVTREHRYNHPEHGLQYPRTTRLMEGSLHWLAGRLGIQAPMPETTQDPRDVA
ncbi:MULTISPECIES: phage antirepressor KilAC domain-containing protein [unclassified Pseudomonas]|uniref:phage antirepressor KilAC domain-containing protein n=1 Tax=unclassified Pseudomonas TaxID=196821 RepID=UPI00244717E1|nr:MULTISPECIES: phage antirepressor KilAC domain-containing protein [unclassified Pseudomonas]MDG9925461.1 phage antirepressor KilAC domain-containing protein [Pseudomonas sp. GD04045]MDH0034098.1 phage antirepressor KilAC domain-containing protein [Pseudomonas sp. GD04019]